MAGTAPAPCKHVYDVLPFHLRAGCTRRDVGEQALQQYEYADMSPFEAEDMPLRGPARRPVVPAEKERRLAEIEAEIEAETLKLSYLKARRRLSQESRERVLRGENVDVVPPLADPVCPHCQSGVEAVTLKPSWPRQSLPDGGHHASGQRPRSHSTSASWAPAPPVGWRDEDLAPPPSPGLGPLPGVPPFPENMIPPPPPRSTSLDMPTTSLARTTRSRSGSGDSGVDMGSPDWHESPAGVFRRTSAPSMLCRPASAAAGAPVAPPRRRRRRSEESRPRSRSQTLASDVPLPAPRPRSKSDAPLPNWD
mmetsp:Transcript_12390/g.31707  ORF Transcript_12390/g.31707 Transcript_12390/m.31707 type:complete len:308 (+) Transcript_12390:80-1003(+)